MTGATGFVGRHAVPALRELGYEVEGVGRGADLLAPGAGERLVARTAPTHLLHLAWTTTPGEYWTSPANERWARASLELVEAFGRGGGERFVGAGTCAEYAWDAGDLEEGVTPERPATVYGREKLATGRLSAACAGAHGFRCCWGRLFFLYGPGEHEARLVPSVARALLAGRPAEVTEGRQVRDFLFSGDAGKAFAALVDSPVEGVVNVASGAAVPVREVVAKVARLVGREDLVRWGAREAPPGEPERLATSARRLREEVGFRPSVGLDDGLARAVAFWRGA